MNRVTFRAGILVLSLLLTGAAGEAAAQMLQSTDRAFAAVNFGSQTKARTFTTTGSQPIYDETATFESVVGIGNERVFDISAGVRVWSNLALGVGFTSYSDSGSAGLTASIPDPLFFDTPVQRGATADGQEHKQQQVHLSAYWLQPLTDKFDVALYAGPTFFSVKQDLLTGITVAAGSTTIASTASTALDESTVGYHAGLDLRYLVLQNVGVGAFVRFTGGSLDVASLAGGKMDVGGFQYGVGIRFRY
jgi:hypothetical protein